MVASASMPYAEYIHENPFYFLVRHGISIVVAAVVAFLTYRVSLNLWFKKCIPVMADYHYLAACCTGGGF